MKEVSISSCCQSIPVTISNNVMFSSLVGREKATSYHYPSYGIGTNFLFNGKGFYPTEFLHGLYDGGHGAGLDDFWKLMQENPLAREVSCGILQIRGCPER